MMNELDEVIQHFGVKGMKWGVKRAKSQLSKAGKGVRNHLRAKAKKKNDRLIKIADKYHEKNKNKRIYKRQYERNLKRFEKRGKYKDPHRRAVLQTRRDVANAKRAILYSLTPIAAPVVAKGTVVGLKYAGAAYRKTMTPSNVIAGKNILQAMKNSPVRYADVSKYKDIIDM